MTLLHINTQNPQKRFLEKTADVLEAGGVILYPTDTVYAYGCDLRQKNAIECIYRLKEIKRTKPLSLVFNDISQMSEYVRNLSDKAYKIMKRVLPGPYTFIFQASKMVPKFVLTKQKTVGVRIPDHPVSMGLIKALESPIISTSAVAPDGELITEPSDIERVFLNQLDLVLDCGCIRPEPSTVVDFSEGGCIVIREGKGPVVW
jgi:tRNA threonylcarbamoyl adenosine modification protein (Sua5/YciO/YrdC/YwlC family)